MNLRMRAMCKVFAMSFLVVTTVVCVTTGRSWCASPGSTVVPGMERTALDRYVATPDPNFSYKLVDTIDGEGYTAYVLDMTSQAWLRPDQVDRPLWKHWVTIVKPDEIESTTGLLVIGGGRNGGNPPTKASGMTVKIAKGTKSVVTSLSMIPNQPLYFPDEHVEEYKKKGRSEDEMIAYCWDKYLKTGDELWATRLPMVKATVRAMDAVTLFCGSEEGGKTTVDTFVVAGGSKRGWTTWMTAAVDARVIAMVPIVIDLLNVEVSFNHHWAAYGFWAPAVGDYVALKIMDYIGDPRFASLMKLVDPYEYRARFTMPKLMLNACGDQFFLPDSSQFYFDDLPGPKYNRYVPNGDHGMDGTDAIETLAAFHYGILYGEPIPEFTWRLLPDGAIRVQAKDAPAEVKLWQATNPDARDFRLETIGKAWTETTLSESEKGVYIGKVDKPAKGWTAFVVELTYKRKGPAPLKLTTQVRVIPDTLPYPYPEPKSP